MSFRHLWHILNLIVIYLYSSMALSAQALEDNATITIVSNNFSGYKSNIAKNVELSKNLSKYRINSVTLENWTSDLQTDLYITVGVEALEAAYKSDIKAPVIAALITSSEWSQLSDKYSNSNFNAIFYDPDPLKQIVLINVIAPKIQSLGVLHSDRYYLDKKLMQKTAKELEIELDFVVNSNSKNFNRKYAEVSRRTESILLVPDKINYNNKSISNAILSSYRQEKFTFGYSKGLVQSGALASTYTSLSSYVKDLVESAEVALSGSATQFVRFSKYYSVETNAKVGKSLDLLLNSNDEIKESIDNILTNLNEKLINEQ